MALPQAAAYPACECEHLRFVQLESTKTLRTVSEQGSHSLHIPILHVPGKITGFPTLRCVHTLHPVNLIRPTR